MTRKRFGAHYLRISIIASAILEMAFSPILGVIVGVVVLPEIATVAFVILVALALVDAPDWIIDTFILLYIVISTICMIAFIGGRARAKIAQIARVQEAGRI